MQLHFTALLRGALTGVARSSAVCLLSSYGLRLGTMPPALPVPLKCAGAN